MALASRPNVIFESKCFPQYLMHCNPSLYTILIELKGTMASQNPSVSQTLHAIQRKTIHWLIRVGGQIECPQHDTATHKCCIPSLSFQDKLDLISSIIHHTLFRGTPIAKDPSFPSQHYCIVDQPTACTTIILSLRCNTQFTIVENNAMTDCLHFIEHQRTVCPTSSIRSLVTSWMIRKMPLICVRQRPQEMDGFNVLDLPITPREECSPQTEFYIPSTAAPFLSLLEDHASATTSCVASQEEIEIVHPNPTPNCHATGITSYQSALRSPTPPQQPTHSLQSSYETPQRPQDLTHSLSTMADVATHSPKKQRTLNQNLFPAHRYSTRGQNGKITEYLLSMSRSKKTIQYVDGQTQRHMPGEKPLLKQHTETHVPLPDYEKHPELKLERVLQFYSLLNFWEPLKKDGIDVPRDSWEDWVDSSISLDDPQANRAFMFLMTICMSSSTSDAQLSTIMPRVFSFGLTSATAVSDIAQKFGMNAFCSILSEAGLFYKNTECILNAADYFIQQYNGTVPLNISIEELSTLYGIGYKTAAIVVEASFGRTNGIPSDIHVMRWSKYLGWTASTSNGYHCSKELESWVPRHFWNRVNPLLGSLSQMAVSSEAPKVRELLVEYKHMCPDFKAKVLSQFDRYTKKRKS